MLERAAKVGEALRPLCKSKSSIWRTALIAAVQNIVLRGDIPAHVAGTCVLRV